jgi:ankyrin repeat protein
LNKTKLRPLLAKAAAEAAATSKVKTKTSPPTTKAKTSPKAPEAAPTSEVQTKTSPPTAKSKASKHNPQKDKITSATDTVLQTLKVTGEKAASHQTNGTAELIYHIRKGNIHDVEELLKDKDVDVNAKDEESGYTALHHAASCGYSAIVSKLIYSRADVNAKCNGGNTPLHNASTNIGGLESVKILTKHKANIKAQNNQGFQPIHYASGGGNLEIIKFLLENGADIKDCTLDGRTTLHFALNIVCKETLENIKFLLDKGVDIDAKDQNGNTALHIAAQGLHDEIVTLLLERGANYYLKNKSEETPLKIVNNNVSDEKKVQIAKANIENKLKKIQRDGIMACLDAQKDNLEALQALITPHDKSISGMSIYNTNAQRQTPFDCACEYGSEKTVAWLLTLLNKETNTQKALEQKNKGFILAVERGHTDIIDLLIQNGADINSETNLGLRALDIALDLGNIEVTRCLLQHNANMYALNQDGDTALHLAVKRGYYEIVDMLLSYNANFWLTNAQGKTPIEIATASTHAKSHDILTLLQEKIQQQQKFFAEYREWEC